MEVSLLCSRENWENRGRIKDGGGDGLGGLFSCLYTCNSTFIFVVNSLRFLNLSSKRYIHSGIEPMHSWG
jgi:hypothetical protein